MTQAFRIIETYIAALSLLRGRLRARVLAVRGASIKQKTSLGCRCRVDRPWCLSMGERSSAESDVYMKIVDDNATLRIGDYVFIGKGSEFDVMEKLTIGDHTVIAPDCFITDHDHGIMPDLRIDQQSCVARPIAIGRDVWLGRGTTVLSGVTIGDGAVVGANAVVRHDVPPLGIVAGVPAKLIRYRNDK